jgi:hypothetical protein
LLSECAVGVVPTALGRYSHIGVLLAETLYIGDLTIPSDIRFTIYLDLFLSVIMNR